MHNKLFYQPIILLLLATMMGGCQSRPATSESPASPTTTPRLTEAPTATSRPTATVAASPTPTCLQEHGLLEQEMYFSQAVSRDVPLWVYLPPCYPLGAEQLPASIYLHGKPFNQSHWINLDVISVYEEGLSAGRWGRALLVFPSIPEPLFSQSDGGPGSYEQEFIDAVLPELNRRYQITSGEQELRLAGISRGGIWALEIGMRYPQRFGQIAALSPSLAVNYPRPSYDPFELAQNPSNYPNRLLLLAGDQDWALDETMRLAEVLQKRGAQVQMEVVPGDHQDPTWQRSLPEVLDYLLPPSQG